MEESENKEVEQVKQEGIDKKELGREKFLEKIYDFK